MSSESGVVPERILVESHGVWLEIEVQDPALSPEVRRILPPGWKEVRAFPEDGHLTIGTNPGGLAYVLVDGDAVIDGVSTALALQVLDAQIRARIAVTAPEFVFVHAGAVALDGRALVLPGLSFSGKTTLVAALIAEGASYFSDEFAVLDGEGLLHPYAKALSLRGEGERRGDLTSVEVLGGHAASKPATVSLVASLVYRTGAQWEPRELTPGAGALKLLGNTVPARTRPAQALATISRAMTGARCIEGERGEADVTARLLLDELQRA